MAAGEEEEVSLTKEKVKWLMPPGVRGTAASESDDYEEGSSGEEEEEDGEEALMRRSCRRGRSAQRRSARQAFRRSPSDPPVRPCKLALVLRAHPSCTRTFDDSDIGGVAQHLAIGRVQGTRLWEA